MYNTIDNLNKMENAGKDNNTIGEKERNDEELKNTAATTLKDREVVSEEQVDTAATTTKGLEGPVAVKSGDMYKVTSDNDGKGACVEKVASKGGRKSKKSTRKNKKGSKKGKKSQKGGSGCSAKMLGGKKKKTSKK
jgi:hypothetical protein